MFSKLICSILLGVAPVIAEAQTSYANEQLKALIQTSFSYFPKMEEVRNGVRIADHGVSLAMSDHLTVNGNASYNYIRPKVQLGLPLGENGENINFLFAPVHAMDANVSAQYLLFDFGRTKANIDKAKADLKLAKDNIAVVENQLAFQVATVYYNIIYYKKAIAIEDSVMAYLDSNKKIIESKLKNGDAIRLDLLNVQASLDNEHNVRANLENALQQQYILLKYTTGLDQASGTDFDFNINILEAEAAYNYAEMQNPDFTVADDKRAKADAELAVTKLQMKPSVVLHGSTGIKNGYVPNVNTMKYNYNAGVGLSVPIYDGNKMKKQILLNQDQIQQEELALNSLKHDYRKNIDQAFEDIKTNIAQISHTAGQIEAAKAAEKLAADRYFNGVGTNLEITNASTNVQRAEFSRLQYQYQLCLAKLRLAQTMGVNYWDAR